MCDNCKKAAYELELQWGAGHIDYAKLKGILTEDRDEENTGNTRELTVRL